MTARPLDPMGQSLKLLILLRRYENQLDYETQQMFAVARTRLTEILQRQDITVVSPGRQMNRFDSVAAKADAVLTETYSKLHAHIKAQLVELGSVQAEATRRLLGRSVATSAVDLAPALGGPTRAQLRAIVTDEPVRGAVMWDWWKRQRLQTRHNFQTQVRLGMTAGESIDDIVRRVRGRSVGGGRFEGGVMNTTTSQASALVRTAVNQIANRAGFETYAQNPDFTTHYEWVSTLDRRTSEICMGLDGKNFRYDDPKAPRPPAHWNCRSTIVPVIDYKKAGLNPPTTKRQTYPEWFKDQPDEVQDEILGKKRAQMLRDGQISFEDLIRKDNTRVTLPELEKEATPPARARIEATTPERYEPQEHGATVEALRAAEATLDRIRGLKREQAIAYNAQGEALLAKQGSEHRVRFRPEQIAKIKGAELFVHNHPNGASFSDADANFIQVHRVKEIHAAARWSGQRDITHRMSIVPGDFINFSREVAAWKKGAERRMDEMTAAWLRKWVQGTLPDEAVQELQFRGLPTKVPDVVGPTMVRDVTQRIRDVLWWEVTHEFWLGMVEKYPERIIYQRLITARKSK